MWERNDVWHNYDASSLWRHLVVCVMVSCVVGCQGSRNGRQSQVDSRSDLSHCSLPPPQAPPPPPPPRPPLFYIIFIMTAHYLYIFILYTCIYNNSFASSSASSSFYCFKLWHSLDLSHTLSTVLRPALSSLAFGPIHAKPESVAYYQRAASSRL